MNRKEFYMITENTEAKIQYILDENGELAEISKDKCKTIEYPIKYKLKNAFEVFVRVDGTENYWISNYGRCVNNLNRKNKTTFFKHKEGKCHYTIFEIDKDGSRWKRETSPEDLVADTFLVSYRGRCKIWHKDGDESNNWYKNLLTVTPQDYRDLKSGKVTWQELNLEQEYIEYENKASYKTYLVYNAIKARCKNTNKNSTIHKCYDDVVMCREWLDDPKAFVKWYLEHYYEVEGESMAVDKDLFGNGSGMYHPDYCCILPQGLNTLLANSKKHYFEGKTEDNSLPFGVYNGKMNKYYGKIQFTGTDKEIKLSEWDTEEEAFAEYKMMKQADILMVAAKYKGKVPDYIYDALLKVEVKPY